MLIVCFKGGLGNQLFEYAFYRALQRRYDTIDVKVDLFKTERLEHNGYELESVFGIKVNEARSHEIALLADRYPADMRYSRLYNFIIQRSRYVLGPKESVIEQPDYTQYYDNVWHLTPLRSYYLRGVWAHEDYYSGVRDSLLAELTFKGELDRRNRDYARTISVAESVSVHFRGGDYMTAGGTLLDAHYYVDAVRYIESRVTHPSFFIFTDDARTMAASGVLGVFENKTHTLIDINKGRDSYKDMWLMSMCRHNILANSSFSYWAAELNSHDDKIVVSSRQGFGMSSRNGFTRRSWVQL